MPADQTRPRPPLLRNRFVLIGLGAIVIALLAGGAMGFSYLFLREPAPAAVGLSTASPTPSAATATTDPSAATGASATPADGSSAATGGFDGAWNVDASIGSFTDFSGSFVATGSRKSLPMSARRPPSAGLPMSRAASRWRGRRSRPPR